MGAYEELLQFTNNKNQDYLQDQIYFIFNFIKKNNWLYLVRNEIEFRMLVKLIEHHGFTKVQNEIIVFCRNKENYIFKKPMLEIKNRLYKKFDVDKEQLKNVQAYKDSLVHEYNNIEIQSFNDFEINLYKSFENKANGFNNFNAIDRSGNNNYWSYEKIESALLGWSEIENI